MDVCLSDCTVFRTFYCMHINMGREGSLLGALHSLELQVGISILKTDSGVEIAWCTNLCLKCKDCIKPSGHSPHA